MLRKNATLFGLFSLASLDFFLLGIQVISKEVSRHVSWVVFGFFVIVLAIQLIILAVVAKCTNDQRIKAGISGLLLAGNIIAFYVAFYEDFLSFNRSQLLLSGLALAAISSLVFYFSHRSSNVLKALVLILAVNSLYTFVSVLSYNPNKVTTNPNAVLAGYQKIQFKSKPNIHLIAFDAAAPAAVVKAHMGLNDLPYVDYLSQNSNIIKNFFSSDSPTKKSFSKQMRLADDRLPDDDYFAGRLESPMSAILHANGYELETGFSEDYFGQKGQYVDDYVSLDSTDGSETVNDSTLCNFSSHKEKILKLYGLCLVYPKLFEQEKPETVRAKNWHQKVFNTISQKAHSGEPWMTINYIFDPIGHTPSTMDGHNKAAVKRYIPVYKKKSEELGDLLPDLIKTIQKNDPNSIVLIYGDHGPILSRRIAVEDNPSFNVDDRYAVFGALYKNGNPCSDPANVEYYRKGYLTIERLMAGIFRCLAKDPTKVDQAVNFHEVYPYDKYLYDK